MNYTKLEARVRRLEKLLKNEDIKTLPNGDLANRVSDVLSGWADTSSSNPQAAIRKLDRMGILDAATNRWYPTPEDVAEAIEYCWNDPIAAFGEGVAKFFIGTMDGVTKCNLTLYPITGGTSRARNIVLKFNW